MKPRNVFKGSANVKRAQNQQPMGIVRKAKTQSVKIQGEGVRLYLDNLPENMLDFNEHVEISVIRVRR